MMCDLKQLRYIIFLRHLKERIFDELHMRSKTAKFLDLRKLRLDNANFLASRINQGKK